MTKHIGCLIGENIRILSNIVSYVIEKQYLLHASIHDLTHLQLLILKVVYHAGSATGGRIARRLSITPAAASQNVDYLVKKELLIRQDGLQDRRKKELILTSDGSQVVDRFDEICQYNRQGVLENFTDSEKEQFNHLLEKYIKTRLAMDDSLDLKCLECGAKYGEKNDCPAGGRDKVCLYTIINSNGEIKKPGK